ncbi:hypothetical protein [Lactobacillus amylovorus]|uniref:hypothetical protein n=1 Tax=Lactobacillus amylovorus TaxID=1604 RepID=UPI001F9D2973|nr:hypothetical protein [Candidatus Dwaynia gallinarum]
MLKKIWNFIKSIFENKSFTSNKVKGNSVKIRQNKVNVKGDMVQNINVGGVTEKEEHTNDE